MSLKLNAVILYTIADIGLQISMLRKRGLEFLDIPDRYYSQLRERLKAAKVTVTEPMDTVSMHPLCDHVTVT